jgi:hypothetical protein
MRKVSRTLQFEGEVIRQVPALVVATKQEECVGVPNLERPQIEYTLQLDQTHANEPIIFRAHLDTKVASVNVISQEEIPCGGRVTTDLEEFHQVVLAMDKFRIQAGAITHWSKEPTYWP